MLSGASVVGVSPSCSRSQRVGGLNRPAERHGSWNTRSSGSRADQRCSTTALDAGTVLGLTSGQTSGEPADARAHAAKQRLLRAVAGTQRGGEAGSLRRGEIEEAQVVVESCSNGSGLDWERLEGTWVLVYTTAADVVPLVRPGLGLPGLPLRAVRVAQQFSKPAEGRVQNVIDVEAAGGPLAEGTTARLVVEASYEVRTVRSIALTFKEAAVEEVRMAPGLQNLLAPAILPRGWWNQRLLMAVEDFSLRIPLPTQFRGRESGRQPSRGVNYLLTYLDAEMLIGRAQGSGGTFIFVRER